MTEEMNRWAERCEFAAFMDHLNNNEKMPCPFCKTEVATMIASMIDSTKTILYYACKLCGDYQVRRNAYGLHRHCPL